MSELEDLQNDFNSLFMLKLEHQLRADVAEEKLKIAIEALRFVASGDLPNHFYRATAVAQTALKQIE